MLNTSLSRILLILKLIIYKFRIHFTLINHKFNLNNHNNSISITIIITAERTSSTRCRKWQRHSVRRPHYRISRSFRIPRPTCRTLCSARDTAEARQVRMSWCSRRITIHVAALCRTYARTTRFIISRSRFRQRRRRRHRRRNTSCVRLRLTSKTETMICFYS